MQQRTGMLYLLFSAIWISRSIHAQGQVNSPVDREKTCRAALQARRQSWSRTTGGYNADLPAGTQRVLKHEDVDSLRSLLRSHRTSEALQFYFDKTYLERVTDLVFFYDSGQLHHEVVVQGCAEITDHQLQGNKRIYVVFFSTELPQRDFAVDSFSPKEERTIQISRRSLDHSSGPLLLSLIKGLGSQFLGDAPRSPLSYPDTTISSLLYDLGAGLRDTNHLYVVMEGIPLAENTWNRVHVAPMSGWRFTNDRGFVTNIANSDGSRFGVGLAGGMTLNAETRDSAGKEIGEDPRLAIYLVGHFDFARSRLPLHPSAFGIAFGTNLLQGQLLDDIFLGASYSRPFGSAICFLIGVDLILSVRDSSAVHTRIAKPFFGIEFRL